MMKSSRDKQIIKTFEDFDRLSTPQTTEVKRIRSGKHRNPKAMMVLNAVRDGTLNINGHNTREVVEMLGKLFPEHAWLYLSVAAICNGLAKEGYLRTKKDPGSVAVKWHIDRRKVLKL